MLAHHQALLPTELAGSLQQFLQADDGAQRLFARLLTRKGPIFFESRLNYREVGDTDQALDSLSNCGLITRSAQVPAEWLLNQLTKSDLLALFPVAGGNQRSASKDTLKTRILSRYPDRRICCVVASNAALVHGARSVPLATRAVTVFWQQR